MKERFCRLHCFLIGLCAYKWNLTIPSSDSQMLVCPQIFSFLLCWGLLVLKQLFNRKFPAIPNNFFIVSGKVREGCVKVKMEIVLCRSGRTSEWVLTSWSCNFPVRVFSWGVKCRGDSRLWEHNLTLVSVDCASTVSHTIKWVIIF